MAKEEKSSKEIEAALAFLKKFSAPESKNAQGASTVKGGGVTSELVFGRSTAEDETEPKEEILAVSDLTRSLKNAVEPVASGCWIEGELASVKRAASGHVYFSLKDTREDAMIDVVMYRFQAAKAGNYLRDGELIQLKGKATLWAPRGRLQFVAELVRPAGRGAILARLEELKKKLAAEGLFAAEKKRALPTDPAHIVLITSAQGAAVRDMIAVAKRRGAVRLTLIPAVVQGAQAPASLLHALEQAERFHYSSQEHRVDLLIIGRGGGSGEDLAAFNDEALVRKLAQFPVPTISAVGHESDDSLCDLVADRRAATPTEAAEIAVPDSAGRHEQLRRTVQQLRRVMLSRLREDAAVLARMSVKLSDPRYALAERQQLLDEYRLRVERAQRLILRRQENRLREIQERVKSVDPRHVLARVRAQQLPLQNRLERAMLRRFQRSTDGLSQLAAKLSSLSPLNVLARGYSITLDSKGKAVTSAGEVLLGQSLRLRFAKGEVRAEVLEVQIETESRQVGE